LIEYESIAFKRVQKPKKRSKDGMKVTSKV